MFRDLNGLDNCVFVTQRIIRMGFPGGSDGKESACNVGDQGSVPGLGRFSGGGHGNPLQYSSLVNSHGWQSMAGYTPWGRRVRHD